MKKMLFEIMEEHLETGIRGYPVGYCITSSVHADKGLFYMDRPLVELASWGPEEVIYLLYHGNQGTKEEVEGFSQDLKKRGECSPEVLEHITKLPREGTPMSLFSCALMIAGMFEGRGDYHEDCLNVIAKIPQIAAAVINHHAGWGEGNPFRSDVSYMENFAQMLNVPEANVQELARAFSLFDVLHFDHGGGNLSTFVGKAVASGLEDMWGSLAAAMNALAGPRHGLANQNSLDFLHTVLDEVGPDVTEKQVEEVVRDHLARKERIPGFGHAVLLVEDPRATIMYDVLLEHYPAHPLAKVALLLRKAGHRVLKENQKISDPYPNVDAVSGTLLTAAGFPYSIYYTVLFGMSRCVGISRQIVYERCEACGGKGTPIVRPRYLFRGHR